MIHKAFRSIERTCSRSDPEATAMNVDHDGETVVGQVIGITTWNVNIGNQTVFLAYDTLDSNMFKLKRKFL